MGGQTPSRTMRLPRTLTGYGCVLMAVFALAGCTNPDEQRPSNAATTQRGPGNAGEPQAPPPTNPSSEATKGATVSPVAALETFAWSYVNWNYHDIVSTRRKLASLSVGSARLAELQALAANAHDTTLARAHIANSGTIVGITSDRQRAETWIVVTLEKTTGNSEYQELAPRYHVTLAKVVAVHGGYAVSEWLPQD